jgi:tRNA modification GTPase
MDTIFALSSGGLPSGVAVIRLSGPRSRAVLETLCGELPVERVAALRAIRDTESGAVIDRGLILWFPGPASFTGEDSAEFHVHGGIAVVQAMLARLGRMPGLRMADAGEFSRRAFENGKLDLTGIEALSDLIAAQTEAQRRLAINQMSGGLRRRIESWRKTIIEMRAMVEADLDFADEDDVPDSVAASVWRAARDLSVRIKAFMDDGNQGEIVRRGVQIVLLGRPNVGKSSLLNALARREVAIVHEEAGTTRDIVEVQLDLSGYAVTVADTAGIREHAGPVEQEGIRRARERAANADLAVWLRAADDEDCYVPAFGGTELVVFRSKDDHGRFGAQGVSVIREDGLNALIAALGQKAEQGAGDLAGVITRQRHRQALKKCVEQLDLAVDQDKLQLELRAEHLREAGDALGGIVGLIDVDDLLDVIFSEFCIGK